MDLQEEYFVRRGVRGHLVKFCDRAHLIMKARNDQEYKWVHATINSHADNNHAVHYQFQVSVNPVIYASSDFSHFAYHHSKMLLDQRLEFDQFESFILDWASKQAGNYVAIHSADAIFVSWEMFCSNYDQWMANFLTWRIIESLSHTFSGSKDERLGYIHDVESWIREKHEKVYLCWKNIRGNLEQKNYAEWLARIINNMHDGEYQKWEKEDLILGR